MASNDIEDVRKVLDSLMESPEKAELMMVLDHTARLDDIVQGIMSRVAKASYSVESFFEMLVELRVPLANAEALLSDLEGVAWGNFGVPWSIVSTVLAVIRSRAHVLRDLNWYLPRQSRMKRTSPHAMPAAAHRAG